MLSLLQHPKSPENSLELTRDTHEACRVMEQNARSIMPVRRLTETRRHATEFAVPLAPACPLDRRGHPSHRDRWDTD